MCFDHSPRNQSEKDMTDNLQSAFYLSSPWVLLGAAAGEGELVYFVSVSTEGQRARSRHPSCRLVFTQSIPWMGLAQTRSGIQTGTLSEYYYRSVSLIRTPLEQVQIVLSLGRAGTVLLTLFVQLVLVLSIMRIS